MVPSKSHPPWLPVFSLLASATLWGLIWYPLRLLNTAGLSGLWITLLCYLAALVAGAGLYRSAPAELAREPLWLGALSIAVGWCNMAFILAVLEGTVVRVLILFYLSPLWTVILGRFILGERITPGGLLVLGAAMTGALIMLWDPAIARPWPREWADWMALSSGLAFAFSNVVVRKMQAITVGTKALVTWLGVVVVAGFGILLSGQPAPQVAAGALFGAVALGIFGFLVMTLTVQYGVTRMPVQRSAIILLFELVVGAVSAQWLAGETLVFGEWVGGVLIILAAVLAAGGQKQ